MNKKCIGCGSILQTENPKEKGYIIKDKIKDSKYCERCFKIIHYNEKIITDLENINDYIIKEVNKKAKYVYFLVDFLNINKETINVFKKIKVPKSLIISKLDIIPKSIKKNKITTWLKEEYGIKEEILFQSSKKNINTKSLLANLESKNIKEVYILGFTNAGKSTLINNLTSATNENKITTSSIPNTTIDFINIKLDNITIIDSPGFTSNNTFYEPNEFDLIKRIMPRTFLKPITYQVKPISSILIEDKLRITSSINNSLTFYISNDIKVNRVFNNNKDLLGLEKITIEVPNNSDLVIKSLGFINVKKACKITINTSKKDLIEVRKSLF
ncbi:MAG: GTPase [Candidatus Coprovivens sp.]